jgi:hypothetical protein
MLRIGAKSIRPFPASRSPSAVRTAAFLPPSVSRLRGKGGMKTDAVLAALHTTAAEIEKSCFGS